MTKTTDRRTRRGASRYDGRRRPGRRQTVATPQQAQHVIVWPLLVVLGLSLLATDTLPGLFAQPAQKRTTLPPGARPLTILVESTRGTVRFRRDRRFRRLTRRTRLQQGDLLVLDPAASCQLRFETNPAVNPADKKAAATARRKILPVNYQDAPAADGENAVAAIILRGYTEITVAEAYQQGDATRTQLDLRQGIIRAGVVRTAVPPSFRIRTPRSVVAVRGTEIRELQASSDRGDILRMGRTGAVATNDAVPLNRSAQAKQGSRKEADPGPRNSRLTRAIENAVLDARLVIRSPHKAGLEVDQSRRQGHDPLTFSKAEPLKSKGNPKFDAQINAGPDSDKPGDGRTDGN